MQAFDTAEKIDPGFAITYLYKGQVHLANNELPAALAEFQHALQLDPRLEPARQALVTLAAPHERAAESCASASTRST